LALLRIVFDLLVTPDWWWSMVVPPPAAITACWAAHALMQRDRKRRASPTPP